MEEPVSGDEDISDEDYYEEENYDEMEQDLMMQPNQNYPNNNISNLSDKFEADGRQAAQIMNESNDIRE